MAGEEAFVGRNKPAQFRQASERTISLQFVPELRKLVPAYIYLPPIRLLSVESRPWYNDRMTPKLTPDQQKALQAANGMVELQDPDTGTFYMLMSRDRIETTASIQRAIEQMNAGLGHSVEQSKKNVKDRLSSSSK
jgi:hypothetical protein